MIKKYAGALMFGAFGGAAPSLLELAGMVRGGSFPGVGYYVALLIFAVMGGVVALAYKEEFSHKAFFLGVGAPALIVAAGSAADVQATTVAAAEGQSRWRAAIVSVAHAQPARDPAPVDATTLLPAPGDATRTLWVRLARDAGKVELVLIKQDGTRVVHRVKRNQTQSQIAIPISAEVIGVAVRTRGDVGPVQPLPAGQSKLVLDVTHEGTFWSGFLRALRMNNRAQKAMDVQAQLVPEPQAAATAAH